MERIGEVSIADAVTESNERVEDAEFASNRFKLSPGVVDDSGLTREVAPGCLEMPLMSERHSFGRESASATTLALPCRYCISVVYSEMYAN